MKRRGPTTEVRVIRSCEGCEFHQTEKYTHQSDWGFDHYCVAPNVGKKRAGESSTTPSWCPFLGER